MSGVASFSAYLASRPIQVMGVWSPRSSTSALQCAQIGR
jgi:hypothetical protein